MNYFQWFIKEGWKKYLWPFLILILIDYGIYRDWYEIINVPLVGVIMELSTFLFIHFIAIYFSVDTYKKYKLPNQ